jgi:transcriptional regulator with XRE-family HTH domain
VTDLGSKLRKLRIAQHLTLDELADKAGMSKSYLWELENRDSQRPSAEKLQAVADALGATVAYFLEDGARAISQHHLDEAFYRDYLKLNRSAKKHLRKILNTFK